MGIFKKLFGKQSKPAKIPDVAEPLDAVAVIEEIRAEGKGARAGDVSVESSPREVFRYTFVRLMARTPTAKLRAEFIERGFTGKVADGYITLVQSALFPGS
jgi:hypothetical protein